MMFTVNRIFKEWNISYKPIAYFKLYSYELDIFIDNF